MAITLHSIEDLNNIGDAAVKTNLPQLDPSLPGSFIRTLVSANSILIYAAQRNIQEALDDFFPQTSSGSFLDFWAEINALTRVPGTVAEGRIVVTGTLATAIPIGTLFGSSASQDKYSSTSATTIAAQVGSVALTGTGATATAVTPVVHSLVSGLSVAISGAGDANYNVTATITVLDENTFTYASTGAGADTGSYSSDFADVPINSIEIGADKNLDVGAVLTLQSTVAGMDGGTQGTVNRDGITGGADIEDDESLRERVLLANSIDPGVFTSAQIRLDALTIPTATRVFITNPLLAFTTDGTDVVARAVTSITQAAGTATALIADTSNLFVGSTVTIAGATAPEYNGDVTIITIVANTSFTFAVDAGAASPAGGTITVSLNKLKNIPQPGIVYVFVLDDDNAPPTPSSTTLTNVKNKVIIKLPAHTPSDNVEVVGPFFVSVNITISGLSPDTTAMRTAIQNSLTAFFEDDAGFAEDIKVNQIIAAIQNTQDLETGVFVDDFTLVAPTVDATVGNGSMGILGTITYS